MNQPFVNQERNGNPDDSPPVAWTIRPLPQGSGAVHCGVALILADGGERPVAMSSKTDQGIRMQMKRHPRYGALPERVMTPDQVIVATVRAVREGGRL